MYTEQDLFNRFKEVSSLFIEGKEYKIKAFEGEKASHVSISRGSRKEYTGKSELHKRWTLRDGKLHYFRKDLVTGQSIPVLAER